MADNKKELDAKVVEYIEQVRKAYEQTEQEVDSLIELFNNKPEDEMKALRDYLGLEGNLLHIAFSNEYVFAMNRSIVLEQLYDQAIYYYQIGIQATKEEALVSIQRRLRKRQFQIDIVRLEIHALESQLNKVNITIIKPNAYITSGFEKQQPGLIYKTQLIKEHTELSIKMGEMKRHLKAYEFRAMDSLK
jgi:hypothetical protein